MIIKFIFLAFLFFIVFVILSAVGLFFKLFTWGSSNSRKFNSGSTQGGMNNPNSSSNRGNSQESSEKIFDKDEGEYVDFVEIKEEDK